MIEVAQSICSWWLSLTNIVSWETTKNLLNSAFTTSLLGSLAGAFAGAFMAQRIAERSKHRAELLGEIRNTNAAIAIVFGICNSLLALKKQHVKNLKESYDAQKAAVLEFKQKHKTREIQNDVAFEFQADLQTLQAPVLPMDTLKEVVFERLSIVGRPLNLVVTLTQTVQSLEESLTMRNKLIQGYKTEFAIDPQRINPLYFGFPYSGSHVNLDYPSTIDAIYSQTDDGIFFGNLLCKDLHEHGKQLSGAFKRKFKMDSPRVAEVDFSPATADGMMPDEKNYADWTTAFVKTH